MGPEEVRAEMVAMGRLHWVTSEGRWHGPHVSPSPSVHPRTLCPAMKSEGPLRSGKRHSLPPASLCR
jgi:hypothetical protein